MKPLTLGAVLRQRVSDRNSATAFLVPPEKGGGDFRAVTYHDFGRQVHDVAGAIRSAGLVKGDRLAILSENCYEWSVVDWACQCLGVIVVPIYPTLPADQVQYILQDCDAKLVLAGDAHQRAKVADFPTEMLRGPESFVERAAGQPFANEEFHALIDAVTPADIATIIYTSGTTGVPKGVILSHRAIVHVVDEVPRTIQVTNSDVFLSFLPQSHVYERIATQFLAINCGATIGFVKNLASIANDIQVIRPTVMMCVPRFLESFAGRVQDAVKKQSPLKQKLFDLALKQGLTKVRGGFAPLYPFLDRIVLEKVRARTGGRMRYFVSGGAALPTHVAEFYMALGLDVLQGYGLTETTGPCAVNRPDFNDYRTVGQPLGAEIRIAEDGEILVRGPGNMDGYWRKPEETAAVLDQEGWFHTGDIGEFVEGRLRITDRKKDILVLANGKNVAPQPLENRLKVSPYIAEAVVFGDGLDHCVALILPDEAKVREALNLAGDVDLTDRADVRALIKKELDLLNKQVANFEMVKKFALINRAPSVENGELTPTMKVKRRVTRENYSELLSTLA